MQAVFEVGLAAEQDPQVHKNSLVRDFEESLQWWLHTRPEVATCPFPLTWPLAPPSHTSVSCVLGPMICHIIYECFLCRGKEYLMARTHCSEAMQAFLLLLPGLGDYFADVPAPQRC